MKKNIKDQIDLAIKAGNQPKANRNGMGLILPIPGARHRVIYNEKGLTPMGKYYYEKTGLPIPGKFQYNQDAVRKGRSSSWGLLVPCRQILAHSLFAGVRMIIEMLSGMNVSTVSSTSMLRSASGVIVVENLSAIDAAR